LARLLPKALGVNEDDVGASSRQRGKRVDRDTAAARHSGLTAETPTAPTTETESAWDRIAELLIELALEHDPAILESFRPRAPGR
jgi:hypothetical protein